MISLPPASRPSVPPSVLGVCITPSVGRGRRASRQGEGQGETNREFKHCGVGRAQVSSDGNALETRDGAGGGGQGSCRHG